MMTFVAQLLHEVWGDDMASPPALDRAHRVSGPADRPGLFPDILTRVHFFTEKEAIRKAARSKPDLTYKGAKIKIFQDLAPNTLRRRRAFRPVTDKLRTLDIQYQRGHPFALIFQWESKRWVVRSYREAAQILHLSATPPTSPPRPQLHKRTPAKPDWSTVRRPLRISRPDEQSASQAKQDIIQHIRSLEGDELATGSQQAPP